MTIMLDCINNSIDDATGTIDKKSFTTCTDNYSVVSNVLVIGGILFSILIIANNLINMRID